MIGMYINYISSVFLFPYVNNKTKAEKEYLKMRNIYLYFIWWIKSVVLKQRFVKDYNWVFFLLI